MTTERFEGGNHGKDANRGEITHSKPEDSRLSAVLIASRAGSPDSAPIPNPIAV
jgi:hypothetical protein